MDTGKDCKDPCITGTNNLWGLGSLTRSRASGSEVGAPSPGHLTTREFLATGKINHQDLSRRSLSESKTWLHPTASSLQHWMPHIKQQAKTGTQTHPSVHRLPKVILSSQTPQNAPPDTALFNRGKRLNSTHQNASTSPSHHEAYASHWTNLTTGSRANRSKRNYDPAA